MKYLITILVMAISLNAWGDCPQFATALEAAMTRVLSRESKKEVAKDTVKEASSVAPTQATLSVNEQAAKQKWASPKAEKYKVKYGSEPDDDFNNRAFINLMESDRQLKSPALYFDVENSVQKKLNDSLIGDKGMVDAINNAFMNRFMANIKESPEFLKYIEGRYIDYKAMRLRVVTEGKDPAKIQSMLDAIYQKTNREFVLEFEKEGFTKLLPPRTDEVPDVSTWFLSGSGETALEANMAARGARNAGFSMGNARTVNFKELVETLHTDVNSIEKLRSLLASDAVLLKSGIMNKSADGAVLPNKDMIAILRKIKPSDCESAAEYAMKIRAKVKNAFNSEISDKHIDDLTTYFQKVDSISPPLFQRERVMIDLAEAKSGIVSVDFTGVGVDNAYEQMRALAAVNYREADKAKFLKDAFTKIQTNVDGVTKDMNGAKRVFTLATKDVMNPAYKPKFSGDDGILMPKQNWGPTQKITLVKELSKTPDPSKFRITFVKTEFSSGAILPAPERSMRVVRAETVEKYIREAVVGVGKISSEKSKKMIFAIDYTPAQKGGTFNLYLGGAKPTEEEKRIIAEAFKRALSIKDDEKAGLMVDAY